MYYFCGKVNQGHVFCQFYRGSPYLRESVMGGSTVLLTVTRIKHNYVLMMCFLVFFFFYSYRTLTFQVYLLVSKIIIHTFSSSSI